MKLYSDNIILKDSIVCGTLVIEGSTISEVLIDKKPDVDFLDFTGKTIMPGIVNMHSTSFMNNNNSRFFSRYPMLKSFSHIDRVNSISGITTMYHTIDFEYMTPDSSNDEILETISFIKSYSERQSLIDHKIHVKFQLGDLNYMDFIFKMVKDNLVDLLTYKGHVKDDSQSYKDEYYFHYLQREFMLDSSTAWAILDRVRYWRNTISMEELNYCIKYANAFNVPLASTKYSVTEQMHRLFKRDISILMDITEEDCEGPINKCGRFATLDINNLWDIDKIITCSSGLTSNCYNILTAKQNCHDLLESVFYLSTELGITRAVRMVSYNPARALGLQSKGEIALGKDADIIVVNTDNSVPLNIMTIAKGKIVSQLNHC